MIEPNMTFDNQNKLKGLKRLKFALGNSIRALTWLVSHESAFKQEVWLLITTLALLPFLPFSLYESVALIIATLFVFLGGLDATQQASQFSGL
ncbi:diacylglycerol kinase [Alteromonas sp. a30]|uniref:diacylglycerol kinase n=1 Tax=Alteromonas sp. a30 TaxID=2730917 RepID=UPI0022807769|nr:diacylglycerol kinase [Alteromonas sp. a30]MCY7295902.1 hypothetical protein [Alteromonas sp. a30]